MPERILLCVEDPGPGLRAVPWERVLAGVRGARVTVLWFSDAPSEPVQAAARRAGAAEVRVLPGAEALRAGLPGFTRALGQWMDTVSARFADTADWWRSRISELNLNHAVWFALLRFHAFADAVEAENAQSCLVVASHALARLARGYAVAHGRACTAWPVSPRERGLVHAVLGALLGRARNLCAELCARRAARSLPRPDRARLLIHAAAARNWTGAGPQRTCRYTAGVGGALPGAAYLVGLARQNMTELKDPAALARDRAALAEQRDLPVAALEAYGSLAGLAARYLWPGGLLSWAARWRRLAREGALDWRGAHAGFLWRADLAYAALKDWPKNRHLEACARRAVHSLGAREVLVPVFELVEGRAVTCGARRAGARVTGLQHGAPGAPHGWRFALAATRARASAVGERFSPHRIAVEGPAAEEMLHAAGWPEGACGLAGAARIRALVPPPGEDPARRVLALGDLHHAKPLFAQALAAARNADLEAVLRPHPNAYDRVRGWLDTDPPPGAEHGRLDAAGRSLADTLAAERPACVLCSGTGAAVEAALAGWPVIVALSNWVPDCGPLTAHPDSGVLRASDPARLAAWCGRLAEDAAYRRDYGARCRAAARGLVAAWGADAAARLTELLTSDEAPAQETTP